LWPVVVAAVVILVATVSMRAFSNRVSQVIRVTVQARMALETPIKKMVGGELVEVDSMEMAQHRTRIMVSLVLMD